MTDTGSVRCSSRRTVSRRRFVAATGASCLTLGLAGCPETGETGPTGNDTGRTEDGIGTVTGTPDEDGEQATVRWAFEPTAVREHGDGILRTLRERGLPDDVDVEFVPVDEDVAQRRSDFDRVLSAEEPRPDLFLMQYDWVSVFRHHDRIQNLTDLLSENAVAGVDDEYFDALTAPARDPESGDIFGVPLFADFPAIHYRRDLVEAAGYDPVEDGWDTDPMSWRDWSHVVADVLDHADVEFGFTTQWDIYEGTACCSFNEVMTSWGGAYFDGREYLFGPVGDRLVTVDAEPVVKSLNMMRKFVHDEDVEGLVAFAGGFTPSDVLGWIDREAREPFVAGRAVMHRDWSPALQTAGRENALGEDLGTMPVPYAVPEAEAAADGAGGTTAAVGGWQVTVNPFSENHRAVSHLIEALLDPGFQVELLERMGWLPPRPALFETTEAQAVDGIGRHLDTLRVAGENAMPHPSTRVWNDQASVIAQQVNRAVARELPAAEALAELRTSLESIERAA
jgi:ABC-type glycerol-3-phosphate transport system substrate-binding protein